MTPLMISVNNVMILNVLHVSIHQLNVCYLVMMVVLPVILRVFVCLAQISFSWILEFVFLVSISVKRVLMLIHALHVLMIQLGMILIIVIVEQHIGKMVLVKYVLLVYIHALLVLI
jgi:hypothetical protein